MAKPRVHLYTVCWDEADMLGFFFRHYDPWVDRYVIYDDGSTDGSLAIIADHPRVELRRFVRSTEGSFCLSHQALQDEVWKESRGKADWVVVTAIDEHLHVPGREMAEYLSEQAVRGVTILPALGFDMNHPTMPENAGLLVDRITRGRPRIAFNKLSIFIPDAVRETGFSAGRHKAEPVGDLKLPQRNELVLWHYKHLGFDRCAVREAAQAERLGPTDKTLRLAEHYSWSKAKLRAFWDQMERESCDLAGAVADRVCVGPLWWSDRIDIRRVAARTEPQPLAKPTVSVLVKSFNHAPYVRQTIESILNQSYQDFEIVVTDDASTDGTAEIVRTFEDPRVRLEVNARNLGISGAMNATISRARGRYFAVLNSDDWALPDRLQRQVDFLDANPHVSVVTAVPCAVDERGEATKAFDDFERPLAFPDFSRRTWLRHFFFESNCICAPTAMIRREAYEAVGPYDRRLTNLQDFDMWIRMLLAGHSIHVMPIATTAFRVRDHNANTSAPRFDTMLRVHFEFSRVLRHYLELDSGDFEALFGDEAQDTVRRPVSRRLAELALRQPSSFHKLFALEVLHDTASVDADFDFLRGAAGAADIFGLERAQQLSDERARSHELEQEAISAKGAIWNDLVAGFINDDACSPRHPHRIAEPLKVFENRAVNGDPQFLRLDYTPEDIRRASALAAAVLEKANAIAGYKEKIAEANALLTERDARLAENRGLLAEQSKRIVKLQSEVKTLSATIHRAEQVIAYVAQRFTSEMKKRSFRRFKHALKVRFFRLPVRTSRYSLIRNSVFFDQNYYLAANPIVKAGKLDPVVHYLQFGGQEGRDPGPQFSEAGYRALSPDVAPTSLSALEHYESHGRNEGRRLVAPGPREQTPDNAELAATTPASLGAAKTTGNRAPLSSVLRQALERLGLFDPATYLEMNEDLQLTGVEPWANFLGDGIRNGRPFTTPNLVARALSRLAPDIQEASLEVNERLSSDSCEQQIQKAADLLVSAGYKVAVYCNSLGNFFMQEIANLVYWQLKALGINTYLRTEESELNESFDIRIFVAPHEFFWLGRGETWRELASAPGSVLYNVEQAQTKWFCAALPYLIRAPLVLDINFQSAILLRQLGRNSIHYMPPYLPACPYTIPELDASQIEHLRGYVFSRRAFDWTQHPGLAERPIDILFIGTGSERRLKAIESLRELTDKYRFVCIYTHQTSPLNEASKQTRNVGLRNPRALAQRSKIILNVHRDWVGYFEWPRMVMQGFWQGACVVSDPCFPDPFFISGTHFLEEATRHLPELLHWLLGTPDGRSKMNEIAAAGHRRAISHEARAAMLAPMLTALHEVVGGAARK
jgi:glycosyltransferase involved in cell wall biosynthesis